MAHGFSGVKEQIDHYAAAFAAAGIAVLVYDHRGFGASDGAPRLEVNHAQQLRDWRDAISFAVKTREFDGADGVGVWGSSFAGGLAIVLGAIDARVWCVVAQIPHVSGRLNGRAMFNAAQRRRLEEAFVADREARFAGAEPRRIPVFSQDPDALVALPPVMSQHYIDRATAQTPSWINEVTLRSVEDLLEFEAGAWIGHVAPKPLLMIVAAEDVCTFTDVQLRIYENACEPKRLLIHRGNHFGTYIDNFLETSTAALAWFGEHIPARDACPAAPRQSAA